VSVRCEIVMILRLNRCMVCTERINQKSLWTYPTELLGDVAHVESRFGLFGDNISFGTR
jgi:hypothetical protein